MYQNDLQFSMEKSLNHPSLIVNKKQSLALANLNYFFSNFSISSVDAALLGRGALSVTSLPVLS